MFNVIRIPTKFSKSIRRMSDREKSELFSMILDIGDGKKIHPPDSLVGDMISLIYGEWMNMESRNGNKPEESLIEYTSEGHGTDCPSDSGHRVEYSRVEYNRVDISSKEDTQALVVPGEKKEYGDPTINLIIKIIKSHNNGLIDGTIQSNRRFGKMLRDKIDKIVGFNGDYEWFLSNLIEKTDQYNISKTTSCESIYYNLATLVKKIQVTNVEEIKKKDKENNGNLPFKHHVI